MPTRSSTSQRAAKNRTSSGATKAKAPPKPRPKRTSTSGASGQPKAPGSNGWPKGTQSWAATGPKPSVPRIPTHPAASFRKGHGVVTSGAGKSRQTFKAKAVNNWGETKATIRSAKGTTRISTYDANGAGQIALRAGKGRGLKKVTGARLQKTEGNGYNTQVHVRKGAGIANKPKVPAAPTTAAGPQPMPTTKTAPEGAYLRKRTR